jgi:hypothetical protein
MAKTKKPKTHKKPKRDNRPEPTGPLTKDIFEVRKEVVRIKYHEREVLHELWPELMMHPLAQLETSLFRSYGSYKAGLTKGEIEELKAIRLEARALHERLAIVYFRLKFKS